MSSTKMHINKSQRGVAMLVVLGVLILVTIFGFVALKIAERDNSVAGNMVDIKSQRMVALAGLNLAVARMQQNPTETIEQIKAFQSDPNKAWLNFETTGKPFAVQSFATWFKVGSGSDQSACNVKILGVGSTQVDNALPIQFLSTGKGRNGEPFEVKGTYFIRGLDYTAIYPTAGPTDGLLARGGLENVDAGVTVDAGIYSGGTGVTKIQSPGSACSYSRVRTRGDLEVYSGVSVAGNSIVGGKLKIENGSNGTFNGNLIIGYSAFSATAAIDLAKGGMTNSASGTTLTVEKNLYVFGTAWGSVSSPINVNINVKNGNFWVRDALVVMEGDVTVGPTGTNASKTWLDRGLYTKSKNYEFNGRLDIGSQEATGDHTFGGWVTVRGDLNLWERPSEYSRLSILDGALLVKGNLATTSSVLTKNGPPSTMPSYLATTWTTYSDAPSLHVDGSAWLGRGIKGMDRSGNLKGIVIKGNLYSERTPQQQFTKGYVELWKPAILNGSLASGFGGSTGEKWQFASSAISTDKTWKYTGTGSSQSNAITGGVGTSQSNDPNFGSYKTATVPARTAPPAPSTLGFAAGELDISLAGNPASEVYTDRMFGTGPGKLNKDNAEYEKIYEAYKTACSLHKDNPPTANDLKCIYDKEVNGSKSLLWDKKFLVIRIAADVNRFNNLSYIPATDRVLPSGVKIFWIIERSRNINGNWYSGVKESIQIVETAFNQVDFGWAGDFYGFIHMTGSYSSIKPMSNPATLYGSLEIANADNAGTNGSGMRINKNGSNTFSIVSNQDVQTSVYSPIAGSFFSSDGVGTGTDAWIIRFNGDRNLSNITKTSQLTVKDGWLQFERIGEFR